MQRLEVSGASYDAHLATAPQHIPTQHDMLPQHLVCKYELNCEYCIITLTKKKAPWWWSDKIETCRSVLKCFMWNYMCIRWLINWSDFWNSLLFRNCNKPFVWRYYIAVQRKEFRHYVVVFSSCFHFTVRHIRVNGNLLAQETESPTRE